MKIKRFITFIAMMLFFTIGFANEGIPNTLITKNPEKEITTVKTNRRKEYAELNIEINKIKTKSIDGLVNGDKNEILFDITHIDTPITDKDFIFVTEELETFPSYSETAGKKRWSNVMKKYKDAYMSKVPVDNNGLKYSTDTVVDEIEGTRSKTLKVIYENPPKGIFIGIVDGEDYSLKAVYKFLPDIDLYNQKAGSSTATVTFSDKVFEDMTVANLMGVVPFAIGNQQVPNFNHVRLFDEIKIIKEKDKQLTIGGNNENNYISISSDNNFLNPVNGDYSNITKLKITNMKGGNGPSLEVSKNQMSTLLLSDGSVFKIQFSTSNGTKGIQNKLELTVIPVVFGTDPNSEFQVELLDNNGLKQSYGTYTFNLKYPSIVTHNGIVVASKDGTKNILSPNSRYEIGSIDDGIIEQVIKNGNDFSSINPEQRKYLGDQIGLTAKGKSLKYLFYLLATNSNVLDIKMTTSNGTSLGNGNNANGSGKYEYTHKPQMANGKQDRELKFIIDKNDYTFNMVVPKWDKSKIVEKFNLVVYMKTSTNNGKEIYKVPITINLPATVTSKGKIDITFFARYEREFNNGAAKLHLIRPDLKEEANKTLDFLSINVEGDYPYSKNLVGAKKFTINEKNGQNNGEKIFNTEEDIVLEGLSDIKIRYKQSIGNGDGIYLAFDEENWKKFIEKNTYGSLNIKVKNDYGHIVGEYEIRVHSRQKRRATFYLNGLESLFAGPVQSGKFNTGKIFGLSNHIPYSEKDQSATSNQNGPYTTAQNIKTGKIFGAVVIGDELRYYDIDPNNPDGKTQIVIRAKSDGGQYGESTIPLTKDKEIDVFTNNGSKLFIGFREQEYNKRDIDGAKKELALYFRLVNYDTAYYFTNETINIAIIRNGIELYRDEINIQINRDIPKETGIDINILKYKGNDGKEYYGRTFIVDGDQLKEVGTNEIFGSVNITGSAGDFPMDLKEVEKFHGQYRLRYEGAITSFANIGHQSIDTIKNGYKLPTKDNASFQYDNQIMIWNDDNKKFKLKVDKSQWDGNPRVVTYLTTDLDLYLVDKNNTRKGTYKFSFFERTNPKHIKGLGEMRINIRDGKLDDYIREYILGSKKLEITANSSGNGSPTMNGFDLNIFEVSYNKKAGSATVNGGQTNIFNMADGRTATTAYYKFYNDHRLIGTGESSMVRANRSTANIAEESKKDISFLDGTKIKFGFSVGKYNTEQQKLLYSLLEFGDEVYNNSQTYKTSVHLDGGRDAKGGAFAVTDIDFTVPKLDYSQKKADIKSKQANKNGLRPDMSFYFGLENGKFGNGGTNKRATDKDVLQILGGDFPYAILRANELPISTLDSFIEFYDGNDVNVVKNKAKYVNGRWEFRYDNGGLLTFEIVGKNGDGVGKNMIKMQVRAWDHSLIDKRYKMRVYSKNRKNYFEVPIIVNIKATEKVENQKLEIKFDNKYKDIADIYTGRFTFSNPKNGNGKQYLELKPIDGSTEKIGELSGTGLANFTPKKTDDLDVTKNRLLNGNKLEVEVNKKRERIVLGEGGIFKLNNGLEAYIGYRGITGGEELEMAVGKWTQELNETIKLIVKNDYGVEVATYDITLKGEADVKDSIEFNFGTINSATKNNITTVEKSVPLSAEVNDIELKFSNKNPVLTLNGKGKDTATNDEKLQILNFGVVYVEKDRLNSKKWNFKVTSEIEQITSSNRKKEGKYTNGEELHLNITVKDSVKGSRAIKR